MLLILGESESVGVVNGIGNFGDRLAVGPNVKYRPGDRGLDVVDPGGGEVNATAAIGAKVVRAEEGLAAAVGAHLANLFAARVDLDQRVAVVARNQQMTIEGDQTVGAAGILVPEDRCTPAVPVLDIACGIFH